MITLILNKHKIYITRIMVQIEKAMKTRGTEITYETKSDTFKMFFTSIPQWWVDNSYSLNSINKNFATIINQIKTNGKGNNFKKAIREEQLTQITATLPKDKQDYLNLNFKSKKAKRL